MPRPWLPEHVVTERKKRWKILNRFLLSTLRLGYNDRLKGRLIAARHSEVLLATTQRLYHCDMSISNTRGKLQGSIVSFERVQRSFK
jgi:hypothetical protein